MSLSQDSFPFESLPPELQENIIQFMPMSSLENLMKTNKVLRKFATDAAEKFRNKEPVLNPFLQYLGFVKYMADCKRKNEKPTFNLEQFANLEHLHYPYDYYSYFGHDISYKYKTKHIFSLLKYADGNYLEHSLINSDQKNFSEQDKKFLENYKVNYSTKPINILAGQYQLIKIFHNENFTNEEKFEKVKDLVNRGVCIYNSYKAFSDEFKNKSDEKTFNYLKSVHDKTEEAVEKAKNNTFTEEDLEKLGKENEAQVNCSNILFYLLKNKQLNLAEKLIRKGCKIREDFIDYNKLIALISEIDIETLKLLKKFNYNINSLVNCDHYKLLFSIFNKDEGLLIDCIEKVKYLIKEGYNIEVKYRDEIVFEEIVKWLKNHNSDNNSDINKLNEICNILKQAHIELAVKYFTEGNLKKAAENLNLVLKHSENKEKDYQTFKCLLEDQVQLNKMDENQKDNFNKKFISLSQDSFLLENLPNEIKKYAIQFFTSEDLIKLRSVNKNMHQSLSSLNIEDSKNFKIKTPISSPHQQYLEFVEYITFCKRNNIQPEFNLEQFANLEHLHHPYNFYTYFVNDQRLRKLPNIRALHLASHNYCGAYLLNCFKGLSDADKEFLGNYEVNSSVTPINLLAGQFQLVQILDNNELTENEQLEKVKKLVNKGVIFNISSLQRFESKPKVAEFFCNILTKNVEINRKVAYNLFTQEDFDKLGQEGEAQFNNIHLLQFLISKNQIEFAKKLIEKGCNINGIDHHSAPYLLNEIITNPKYFSEFKQYNFNINIVNEYYEGILSILDNKKDLDFLIKNGLDIEVKNNDNTTAFERSFESYLRIALLAPELKQAHIELAVKYFAESNFKRAAENLNLILNHSENKSSDISEFKTKLNVQINFTEMDVRQRIDYGKKLSEFMKLIQTEKSIA